MRHNSIARRPERLLALDIETVPDRQRLPADHGDRFPKPIHHKIACISFVEATITLDADGSECFAVQSCRSGGEADWDERRLLVEFWRYFERQPTRICGWNSRGFDVPVILQRSMVYGISAAPWFRSGARTDSYSYRYSDAWHADIMDLVADHGACAKLGLDEAATACGLPGKMVAHGDEVERLVEQGRIAEVRDYCEIDCLNTAGLYMRYALLTGRTSPDGYASSIESIIAYLEQERTGRVHLGTFLDEWLATSGAEGAAPALPLPADTAHPVKAHLSPNIAQDASLRTVPL